MIYARYLPPENYLLNAGNRVGGRQRGGEVPRLSPGNPVDSTNGRDVDVAGGGWGSPQAQAGSGWGSPQAQAGSGWG